jgi:hypothetical protein
VLPVFDIELDVVADPETECDWVLDKDVVFVRDIVQLNVLDGEPVIVFDREDENDNEKE